MKKYMDIQRLKPAFIDGFKPGDHIVIQEKVDGANFSFKYDAETDSIKSFSRKHELTWDNNLRGAWNWASELNKEKVKKYLGDNLIVFSEWLVKHTVKYPQDAYMKAYCYDIYDTEKKEYLPQTKVKEIISALNLIYVPVFYDGEFISWEHIKEFVGRTELNASPQGEGIVIKNQSRLDDKNSRLPYYVKLVHESFSETKAHKTKEVDMEKVAEKGKLRNIVSTIVTLPRIRKMIHKFEDDGQLEVNWDARDMKTISKLLPKAIYYDCIKEEKDTVDLVGESFGAVSAKISMELARELLKEKESF